MKKKIKKKAKDLSKVIKRQRLWSTEAKKEGMASKKRITRDKKKGLDELAKDDLREYKDDIFWAKKRKILADKAKNKYKKITGNDYDKRK